MHDQPNYSLLLAILPDKSVRNMLIKILDAIPNIAGLLDGDRRLVYGNAALLKASNIPNFKAALNLRPGDLFECANSDSEMGGCGSSEACGLCGAFNALKKTRIDKESVTKEFRIVSKTSNQVKQYTFRFTSSPIIIQDKLYFLINLHDIDSEKRQAELERVFYHDILNSLGSLSGIIHLLKTREKVDPFYLNILESTYDVMYDMINEQKQFSRAQSGELSINNQEIQLRSYINKIIAPFNNKIRYKAKIKLSEDVVNISIISDPTILSRIITNMIKNAVEASEENDGITVGADKIDNYIHIWVHNPVFIPRETQLQIFERSFSTKGKGRGLGTFGMKLLGENYLGGKVGFKSIEKDGTTFWIELPLKS